MSAVELNGPESGITYRSFLFSTESQFLTDLLPPVAGDSAADPGGLVLTGGVSQSFSTVSVTRNTLPVSSLCSRAF